MKCFIIIICVFLKLCDADLSANVSKTSCDDLEQKNLKLVLENGEFAKTIADSNIEKGQLQKTFADSNIENGQLQKSIADSKIENGQLQKSIADLNIENGQLQKTIANLKIENGQLQKTIAESNKTNANLNVELSGLKEKNNNLTKRLELVDNKETGCICKTLPQSKFVDKTLYEKACDVKKSNGEWTIIQRRIDGSVNFTRGWADYKVGFGTITGEFFIGLDNLHLLTTCAPQELRIEMEDHKNKKRYAQFDIFQIGDEVDKYAMEKLGNYTGDAGDSLSYHRSQKFSTLDQDNDSDSSRNCAIERKGGWWFNACHRSNLNGEFGNNDYGRGINWYDWHGWSYSLKKVEMKIRPKN